MKRPTDKPAPPTGEKPTFPPATRAFLIIGQELEPNIKGGQIVFISPLAGTRVRHELAEYIAYDEQGRLRIVGHLHGRYERQS